MFLTTPRRTLPSASVSSVCFFFSAFSSSRRPLRESTIFPRFLFTLMPRIRSSWPRRASRLRKGRTSIWEPGRQDGANADVYRQAALDPLDHSPDHDFLLRVCLLDVVPDFHLLGFFARADDVAFTVFGAFQQHIDDVAGLDGDLPGFIHELVHGDDAFGLVADVDDDF